MKKRANGTIVFSPSDLIVFMESEFASFMDRFHLESPGQATPDEGDASAIILRNLGIEHETRFLETLKNSGLNVVEVDSNVNSTLEALKNGSDVIYQAELQNGIFAGKSDFLLKGPGKSKFGDFQYQVWDTKLARKSKPYFLIQLCCYAEMLEAIQGVLPDFIGVVLGDSTSKLFRTGDYYYYYKQLKNEFLEKQHNFDPTKRPFPEPRVEHGRWNTLAEKILEEADHLSKVANIRKTQITKLETAGIKTFTELAKSTETRIPKMETNTLRVLQHQARLQLESAGLPFPKYELIENADVTARKGLQLLSPASFNDVFFDMEGYPYIEGGLEYLFGASYYDGEKLLFADFWAHNHAEEKIAFESFIDWVYARWQNDPNMHIYHYADYEVAAMRRLMGRHGTRESEVDSLLRNNVFINLYTVVRQSLRIGVPSYSIKKVELLYREKRDTEVSSAMDSVVAYHNWLQNKDGDNHESSEVLREIRAYNKDDCDSTAQLCEWLRKVQDAHNIGFVPIEKQKNEDENARPPAINPSEKLAQELLRNLPEDAEESRMKGLLAHLLEFHWRESKPIFWAKFDRHEMTEEQLIEEPNCLGGLRRTDRAAEKVSRSFAYEYRFDPSQDTKLEVGSKCFFSHDLKLKTEILKLDEDNGLVEIKISPKSEAPPEILSLIPDEFVDPQPLADSLLRIVSKWNCGESLPKAADDFLRRKRPKLTGNESGPVVAGANNLDGIIEAVKNLDCSTLCIQGPPGSGKTYTAAKIIVALLKDGKRVGVTSNSHKAISKLLKDIEDESKTSGYKLKGSKIQSDLKDFGLDGTSFAASTSADYVFGTGKSRFTLIGGTAWTFCDEAAENGVDYLFVDEAGQVSVANLLAMSPCTKNIVLMGDQMQLSQPIKGTHPGESGLSALNYLLQEKQTIPADFGIFLATSFRMQEELCNFVSEAVYEGRLHVDVRAKKRKLIAPGGYDSNISKASGVLFIPVEHEGNTQSSAEEVEVIRGLISDLCSFRLGVDGEETDLQKSDIVVVAPYNMQVRALKNVHSADRVGTVDKFQGQEAAVVIVSMCASDGSESARGMQFLFSRNRLNVAISRAQCLTIVVGCPRLARTECSSVEQMALVNLFCRFMEGSQDIAEKKR